MEKRMKEIVYHPIFLLSILYIFFPFIFPYLGGYTALATDILIFSLYCIAYNLLLGYSGLMSFGHGCLFGTGAYVLGLTQCHLVSGICVPLIFGMAAGGLVAFLIGWVILRRSGIYFALLTVAFTQMFFVIAFRWTEVTGGENGFSGIVRYPLVVIPGLLQIPLKSSIAFYYFTLFFYFLSLVILWKMVHSPFGRVLKGIRFNRDRCLFLGYNIFRYRLVAMTISGLFSGLAGAFHALHISGAFADDMSWLASGDVVMMTVLGGGLSNFFGPVLGAAIFLILQDLVSALTSHWMIIFGLLFVAFILLMPEGILGFLGRGSGDRSSLFLKIKQLLKP
jgi:ABC-type branched-subunit amino acid transport system permease subunit